MPPRLFQPYPLSPNRPLFDNPGLYIMLRKRPGLPPAWVLVITDKWNGTQAEFEDEPGFLIEGSLTPHTFDDRNTINALLFLFITKLADPEDLAECVQRTKEFVTGFQAGVRPPQGYANALAVFQHMLETLRVHGFVGPSSNVLVDQVRAWERYLVGRVEANLMPAQLYTAVPLFEPN